MLKYLLVAGLLALAGCRENTEPGKARALRDELGDSYLSWSRVPGYEKRRASDTAHGEEVDIYWNGTAESSAPQGRLAPGSIVVKEAYDDDDEPITVAVMEKRVDGWFWAEWSPSGEILFSGRPNVCIDCHRRGDDFLRSITPSSTGARQRADRAEGR